MFIFSAFPYLSWQLISHFFFFPSIWITPVFSLISDSLEIYWGCLLSSGILRLNMASKALLQVLSPMGSRVVAPPDSHLELELCEGRDQLFAYPNVTTSWHSAWHIASHQCKFVKWRKKGKHSSGPLLSHAGLILEPFVPATGQFLLPQVSFQGCLL